MTDLTTNPAAERTAKSTRGKASPVRLTFESPGGVVTIELRDADTVRAAVGLLERARRIGRKALAAGLSVEAFAIALDELRAADEHARQAAEGRRKLAALFAPNA